MPKPAAEPAKHGWGRLWNLLGTTTQATDGLSLTRHHTAEVKASSHGRQGSDGIPRSLTRTDSSSARKKAKRGVARLFTALGKTPSDQGGADGGDQDEDGPSVSVAETMQRMSALPSWERPEPALFSGKYIISASPQLHKAPQISETFLDSFVLHQNFGLLVEVASGSDIVSAKQHLNLQTSEVPKYSTGSVSNRSVSARSTSSQASTRSATSAVEAEKAMRASREHDIIRFYSKHGSLKDVTLGEVIEELCLTASAIKTAEGVKVHYINGGSLISLSARVSSHSKAASVHSTADEDDGDVETVAAMLRTDHDQAKDALVAAETAVQIAAGRGPVGESKKGIHMWYATAGKVVQSSMRPMSESTYLMSFGKFLEALMFNPALANQQQAPVGLDSSASLPPMRFFRLGDVLVRVSTRRFQMFGLHLQGPVMSYALPSATTIKSLPIESGRNAAVSQLRSLQVMMIG